VKLLPAGRGGEGKKQSGTSSSAASRQRDTRKEKSLMCKNKKNVDIGNGGLVLNLVDVFPPFLGVGRSVAHCLSLGRSCFGQSFSGSLCGC
jgi:hypothetical protein